MYPKHNLIGRIFIPKSEDWELWRESNPYFMYTKRRQTKGILGLIDLLKKEICEQNIWGDKQAGLFQS